MSSVLRFQDGCAGDCGRVTRSISALASPGDRSSANPFGGGGIAPSSSKTKPFGGAGIVEVDATGYTSSRMVYLPWLVVAVIALVIAGWRKGLEIVLASLFLCVIFGWFGFVDVRPVPANILRGLRGVCGFPLYLVRNPGEWLPILLPVGVLVAALTLGFAARGIRRLWIRRG